MALSRLDLFRIASIYPAPSIVIYFYTASFFGLLDLSDGAAFVDGFSGLSQFQFVFEITGDDIAALADDDLRALVGRLCEAELRAHGLPTAAVTWGGNQNAKDGGPDVRIAQPHIASGRPGLHLHSCGRGGCRLGRIGTHFSVF